MKGVPTNVLSTAPAACASIAVKAAAIIPENTGRRMLFSIRGTVSAPIRSAIGNPAENQAWCLRPASRRRQASDGWIGGF
jgi:hypothetical protein